MAASAVQSLVGDPMLLPPRDAPYCLRSAYELVVDECRDEIILAWGDCYLSVKVDGDTDTLNPCFHGEPFVPSERYRNLAACSPWDRLIGKECDWTWVAVNQQGYRDLIAFSFDVMAPQVILHALASSIEVLTVSQERERHQTGGRGQVMDRLNVGVGKGGVVVKNVRSSCDAASIEPGNQKPADGK